MMRLRSGLMGSMSAWLPSRRSTAHQRGACVMRLDGHVRSGRSTTICSWKGRYRWIGIADGFCVFFMVLVLSRFGSDQPMTNTATREAWRLGLVAAAKEKQTEQHNNRVTPPRVARTAALTIRMRKTLGGAESARRREFQHDENDPARWHRVSRRDRLPAPCRVRGHWR